MKYQYCITACFDCAAESKNCATACIESEDIIRFTPCIRLVHGSSSICELALDAIAEESEFIKQICRLCARICLSCAIECEKYPQTEYCKNCAKACRKCANECIQVSNAA